MSEAAEKPQEDASTVPLSVELLRLGDGLDNVVAVFDFYAEATSAILKDGGSTDRQQLGMYLTAKWILETGERLSEDLDIVCQSVPD